MKDILLLILGLIFLAVFSDSFVKSTSNIAKSFKIPKMVVALTLASFGTCAPELAVSFNSVMNNSFDISLANVIGSCVINILFVIGLASLIRPLKIKTATVTRELPLLSLTSLVFCLLFLDKVLTRYDAIILILTFFIFVYYLYNLAKKFRVVEEEEVKVNKIKSIILSFISLIFIIWGSNLVVDGIINISNNYNIAPKLISFIALAIGTSLPELIITVSAAIKGEFDMSVGNIIGSNIFNLCIVLGLPVLLFGNVYTNSFNYVDLFMVLLSSTLFYLLGKSERTISRNEGFIMILLFLLYYGYIIIL